MKSYMVMIKRLKKWYVTDRGLNKMAAEVIRDYYLDRGIDSRVVEEG